MLLQAASSRPQRGLGQLHCETVVAASLERTFAFFADAANLERLTPPWLEFHITTPMPVVMRAGAEITYRIRLYGIPIPWRSRIEVWEPGVRFVDRQIVGPYLWWNHEHRFEAGASGTRVIDHVEYVPRAAWISGRVVRRDLERIFEYRQNALPRLFAA
jgi:ligand-binding SRPBCC domain-containing protein